MTIDKSIGWAEATWNPVTGCTRGCPYCYAREMHHRFEKHWGYDFKPQLHPSRLSQPYSWKKPRIVFVCSMGELFEADRWEVLQVLRVCQDNPQHRFLILTKLAEELYEYIYPRNVWLGVTVEGDYNEDRISYLLETNASVKFISFEPLQRPTSPDLVIIGRRRRDSR